MFAAGLTLLAPAPQAEASSWGWTSGAEQPALTWSSGWYSHWKKKIRKYRAYKKKRARVPELDASTAGSAMVLLLGGVAYIASRRRDEDEGA